MKSTISVQFNLDRRMVSTADVASPDRDVFEALEHAIQYAPNICVHRHNTPVPFNHLPLGSFHPGVVQSAYIDGSVHVVNDEIDLVTLKALATANGKEVVSSDN